ncbi:MAG TPA: integrase core domain-containing protein [Nitrospira sp.]|nr:integrase core domain-containing protein [Nitrospira sp.]
MDGKGCWRDRVFVKQLWKSLKVICTRMTPYSTDQQGLERYRMFYNQTRPHQALDGYTPDNASTSTLLPVTFFID